MAASVTASATPSDEREAVGVSPVDDGDVVGAIAGEAQIRRLAV